MKTIPENSSLYLDNYTPPELQVLSYDVLLNNAQYINWMSVYFGYFKVIPSLKGIDSLNYNKVTKWIEKDLANKIAKKHIKERVKSKTKRELLSVLYLMKDNVLIDVEDNGYARILYGQGMEEVAELYVCQLLKFKQKYKGHTISIVINRGYELGFEDLKLPKPKVVLEKNYNDDIIPFHEKTMNFLKAKSQSGIVFLHGTPGTGKSTYISYLIHKLNKRVLFLSPKFAVNLDSPEFIDNLIENKDSVIVIEDAEDLIVSRENGNASNVSTLLNITDGILGECMGIKIIATFNTQLDKIDKALLRKGRLKAMYEFKPLSVEKSQSLMEELQTTNKNGGIMQTMVVEPMTLADIYNAGEQEYAVSNCQRTPIGFGIRVA